MYFTPNCSRHNCRFVACEAFSGDEDAFSGDEDKEGGAYM